MSRSIEQEDYTKEVAAISAVMSYHLFDLIVKTHDEGTIHTFYVISDLAKQFYQDHLHIKDWAEYVEQFEDCTDWEDLIITYTEKKLNLWSGSVRT